MKYLAGKKSTKVSSNILYITNRPNQHNSKIIMSFHKLSGLIFPIFILRTNSSVQFQDFLCQFNDLMLGTIYTEVLRFKNNTHKNICDKNKAENTYLNNGYNIPVVRNICLVEMLTHGFEPKLSICRCKAPTKRVKMFIPKNDCSRQSKSMNNNSKNNSMANCIN